MCRWWKKKLLKVWFWPLKCIKLRRETILLNLTVKFIDLSVPTIFKTKGKVKLAFNASHKNCRSSSSLSSNLRQTLFIHCRHHSSNATSRFSSVKFFAVPANAKTTIPDETEEASQSHYVHSSTSTATRSSEWFPQKVFFVRLHFGMVTLVYLLTES